MIILVGCEKGGVGKTTVAVNIAVELKKGGSDVLLVNADRQESADDWIEARVESKLPAIPFVVVRGSSLAKQVGDLAKRYTDVVIDVGGRDSVELRQAMSVADVQVMPCVPSQFDLNTMYKMDRLVAEARAFNPELAVFALINQAPTNPAQQDTEEARAALADMEHYSTLKATLYARKAYRACGRHGAGVTELNQDPKAVAEVQALHAELFGHKEGA